MKKIMTLIAALAVIAGAAQAQNNNRGGQGGQPQTQQSGKQGAQPSGQTGSQSGKQGQVSGGQSGKSQPATQSGKQTSQPAGQSQPQSGSQTGKQGQMQPQSGKSGQSGAQAQPQQGPQGGQQRVDNARQTMNDARQDYKDTKAQVKVDNRQQPTYQPSAGKEPRKMETGKPQVAPHRDWSRDDRVLRTNASKIVVYTAFATRAEAQDYIRRLLNERYYEIESYGTNSLRTSMVLIPTGYNSTAMFAMKFTFTKVSGGVKVTMSAQYRESSLVSTLINLIFQPDSSYATYYAWNVLEDIAESLPHQRLAFER